MFNCHLWVKRNQMLQKSACVTRPFPKTTCTSIGNMKKNIEKYPLKCVSVCGCVSKPQSVHFGRADKTTTKPVKRTLMSHNLHNTKINVSPHPYPNPPTHTHTHTQFHCRPCDLVTL